MADMTLPAASPLTARSPLTRPVTLGVIVGNRGFFPHHLALTGRETILQTLEKAGIKAIIPGEEQTNFGALESLAESRLCAELFRDNRDKIDGILVTLPNFGDERAIANTIRFAELGVPVLIHAFPDDATKMDIEWRRDSFCGKMSACNNLRQYGIKYSLTTNHTEDPTSELFMADLKRFAALCRVVRGLSHARLGMLGARPQNFKTVRFSEKLLENHGVSVDTLDLSEALGQIERMADDAPKVVAKRASIERYANAKGVPELALIKMSKLGVILDDWQTEAELDATAIQCWTSLQENFGVVPCTIMSMASNGLVPSACETDIVGVLSMLALQLASGKPSAIVDWNNNYGDDPDKAVIFHCSNLPKDVFIDEIPVMDYQAIIAGTVGKDKTYGTINARVKESPFTYLRISTDDLNGKMVAYVGEGVSTDDPMTTFGGYGVVKIPRMQELLAYICENGYEHHVSMNQTRIAPVMHEALSKYLGYSTYWHK